MPSDLSDSPKPLLEPRWPLDLGSKEYWKWLDGLPTRVRDSLIGSETGNRLTIKQLHTLAMFIYLSNVHFTQFAGWTISQPNARLQAARWIAEQFEHVNEVMMDMPILSVTVGDLSPSNG